MESIALDRTLPHSQTHPPKLYKTQSDTEPDTMADAEEPTKVVPIAEAADTTEQTKEVPVVEAAAKKAPKPKKEKKEKAVQAPKPQKKKMEVGGLYGQMGNGH